MRIFSAVWLVCVCAACRTLPSDPGARPAKALPFDVAWIYSDERRELESTPQFQWLSDSQLLLLEPAGSRAAQELVMLDPVTLLRNVWLERDRLLGLLSRFTDPVPDEMLWPQEFSANGRAGLWVHDGDLFVLDRIARTLIPLTDTPEAETAAHFSPDGTMVSFVRDNDLYVYDLATREERRLTLDGSPHILNGTLSWVYWEEIFGRRDIGYWWSEDSRKIAFLQTDQTNVATSHFLDFEPYTARVISQKYPKAGTENPGVRVGVVSATGGETTWMNLDGLNYEYVIRVQWLPDDEQIALQTMNRAQTELDLYLINVKDGAPRRILQESDPSWVNIHDDLVFLDDGRHFIWESERTGFAHLYLYELDGSLVRPLTEGQWAVHAAASAFWIRRAIAAVDEQEGWLYFTALKDASIERHLYRVRLDGQESQRLTPTGGVHNVAFSPNRDFFVDRSSSRREPPSLTLHSSDGALRTQLHKAGDPIRKFGLTAPELFTIPAADGFPQPAEWMKPRNFDPGQRYPVILYVYGGPSAPSVKNEWRGASFYFDQLLANRGFLVLRVDNRSATAISKTLENSITGKMYGTSELTDLRATVAWLEQQPFVDADRLGIWGWSGGGTFTLLAMLHTRSFRAGIAVAPVTDWGYYDTKWAEASMKTPQENPDGYAAFDLNAKADRLHGDLLLVHGTYDDNVHPANTWKFADALIAANKQFDMMIYPMRKHGIADDPARIHLYNKMLAFWEQHLR